MEYGKGGFKMREVKLERCKVPSKWKVCSLRRDNYAKGKEGKWKNILYFLTISWLYLHLLCRTWIRAIWKDFCRRWSRILQEIEKGNNSPISISHPTPRFHRPATWGTLKFSRLEFVWLENAKQHVFCHM